MIDWQRVTVLRDEVGQDDFNEVVELFLEEVEEVIDRLRQTTNHATLEEDLHFLKGSALNLGFASFSEKCQRGERMSANGEENLVDLRDILADFDTSKRLFMTDLPKAFGTQTSL
jgi:HPt (histidine-containing phosphotransfer) domain-containing protein